MKKSFFGLLLAGVVFAFALSLAAALVYPATAAAQESNPEAVMTSSEGEFTVETWPYNGKTSVLVYRMVQVGDITVKSADTWLYYSAIGWSYAYSNERKGYTIKGQLYVIAANQGFGVATGEPNYSKKLAWGIGLKAGQTVSTRLDFEREYLFGSGFANAAEATNFAKKFIAYATKFPR